LAKTVKNDVQAKNRQFSKKTPQNVKKRKKNLHKSKVFTTFAR